MYILADPLGMLGAFAVVFVIYAVLFSVGAHLKDQETIQGAPSSHPKNAPKYGGGRRAA